MPEEFVKMEKDGKYIEVHPFVVAAHEAIGWKRVVTEDIPLEETPSEEKSSEQKAQPSKRKTK